MIADFRHFSAAFMAQIFSLLGYYFFLALSSFDTDICSLRPQLS
jgi:hypothetical protein